MGIEDVGRSDAALVYRYLRDHGAASAVQIAEACFPLSFGRSDPLYGRLIKRSVGRALSSVSWMRDHGVDVRCVMSTVPGDLSLFSITSRGGDAGASAEG
jgi:hypothetical protein